MLAEMHNHTIPSNLPPTVIDRYESNDLIYAKILKRPCYGQMTQPNCPAASLFKSYEIDELTIAPQDKKSVSYEDYLTRFIEVCKNAGCLQCATMLAGGLSLDQLTMIENMDDHN